VNLHLLSAQLDYDCSIVEEEAEHQTDADQLDFVRLDDYRKAVDQPDDCRKTVGRPDDCRKVVD
jgi:hypothetical protein